MSLKFFRFPVQERSDSEAHRRTALSLFTKRILLALVFSLSFVKGVQCSENQPKSDNSVQVLSGVANWEVGQIEEGFSAKKNGRVDREFLNRSSVWLWSGVQLAENAKATLGVGGVYFFVYPRNIGDNPYVFTRRSGFGLTEASMEINLGNLSDGDYLANVKAGIFLYKSNADAKNLGNYLYRTWTYPNVITTGGFDIVDNTATQLSGLLIASKIKGFSNEMLLTIQSDRPPIYGLSLADLVGYKIGALRFGAGIMWDNFYVPEKDGKQPKVKEDNRYYTLKDGTKVSNTKFKYDGTSEALIVDTSYYSFEGFKPVATASIDLGQMINSDFIAEGEFKVYYEAVIMGLENRPTYYEKLNHRVAQMFGINIPTVGLLDCLAFEMEKTSNPFRNSMAGALLDGAATPSVSNFGDPAQVNVTRDDIKWTFFAKKKIFPKASIMLQVANDHLRTLSVFSELENLGMLQYGNHWYWVMKMQFSL